MSNLAILSLIQKIQPIEIKLHLSELTMAAEAYLKLNEAKFSPTTLATYKGTLEYLISFTQGDLSSGKLLALTKKLDDDFSPRTANKYLASYRSFFSFLKKHHIVPSNYFEDIKGHRVDKRDSPYIALKDHEVRSLIEASAQLGPNQELAIYLSFSLGLRVAEVTNIKVNDFDGETLVITGKGNKKRYLGLSSSAIDLLNRYVKTHRPQGHLVQSQESNGSRVANSTVWRWFKTCAQIAKIDPDKVTCHVARATAITKALDAGESIRDVANFVGHSSTDTTMIYDSKRGIGSKKVAKAIRY